MKVFFKLFCCIIGIHDWNVKDETRFYDGEHQTSINIGMDSYDLGDYYRNAVCNICGKEDNSLLKRKEEFIKEQKIKEKEFKKEMEKLKEFRIKVRREMKSLMKQCSIRFKDNKEDY